MHVYSADCGVLCCVLHSSCVCVSCIVRWSSVTRHILVEVSEALLLFQSPSTLLVVAGASRPSFFFPPVATCTGTKETKKRLGNALARFPTIRFHGGITGELQRISALFWSRAGVVPLSNTNGGFASSGIAFPRPSIFFYASLTKPSPELIRSLYQICHGLRASLAEKLLSPR